MLSLIAFTFTSNMFFTKPIPATAQTNKIKGSEVLIIGDSFLAMSHDITRRLEQHAKTAGILDQNDSFRDLSVSGTMLSGGISPNIPTQYQNGVNAGTVKYVIMNGGGNDSMGGNINNAYATARNLFEEMAKNQGIKVFYLFYPDPVGYMANMIKPNLDILRPQIKDLVTNSTSPEAYFLDLRPTFEGKYNTYIMSDGIHPTTEGSYAAADAMWAEMQRVGFFETNPPTITYGDCNKDGYVDALDLFEMKKHLMDVRNTYHDYMDLNTDNYIDAIDLAIMKQYLLGYINKLPAN